MKLWVFWVVQWFGGVVVGLVDGCNVWVVICGDCGFVIWF